ncbi:protein GL2-INTERACTING REPRESSOR 1-like [Cornus florida]|uniref:protein GL2-INTERACTING REPRESSOR 1-like n=1 Tax=Cornus florida TaxID=4283 RepID=UPI00289851A4|nr:protein GL2-INTERACTING REPRESSOR 1-like [Cornus florida]
MALEVQNQQPQPLEQGHVSGGLASHDHDVLTGLSLASLRRPIPVTLDLFHTSQPSSHIESEDLYPLPLGCQKILKLKALEISNNKIVKKRYLEDTTMSRQNGNGPKLDLKLNLSPPRANRVQSPSRSASVSPTSPPSSCVSSELNQDETLRYSNSPEATSMMLVGCPRCLMYVMLSEEDPRCPKCKSTVLLDVLHDNAASATATATATTKKTKKS